MAGSSKAKKPLRKSAVRWADPVIRPEMEVWSTVPLLLDYTKW